MAIILSLETATNRASVAIHNDGILLASTLFTDGTMQSSLLASALNWVFTAAGVTVKDMVAVAVSIGPGSYTGLRIGVNYAKGMAYGLDVPLIPIPTLLVLANGAKQLLNSANVDIADHQLMPMIDARRAEVYQAIYLANNLKQVASAEATIIDVNYICNKYYNITYYFGDGATKCIPFMDKVNYIHLPNIYPDAINMGSLAYEALQTNITASAAEIAPFYLKEAHITQSNPKN